MHKKLLKCTEKWKFEPLQFLDYWASIDKDYVIWLRTSKQLYGPGGKNYFVKYLQNAVLKYIIIHMV